MRQNLRLTTFLKQFQESLPTPSHFLSAVSTIVELRLTLRPNFEGTFYFLPQLAS